LRSISRPGAETLKKKPLAEFEAECEWRQGLHEAQLFADYFAVSSHNNSEEHFLPDVLLVLQKRL
jgi:hypothetical protein